MTLTTKYSEAIDKWNQNINFNHMHGDLRLKDIDVQTLVNILEGSQTCCLLEKYLAKLTESYDQLQSI